MPFQFSFSTSASVVTSASINNGRETTTKGVGYRREQYSNQHGTGVRVTKQRLGEDPIVKTRMFDAEGRPLLIDDGSGSGSRRRQRSRWGRYEDDQNEVDTGRRIEDITEEYHEDEDSEVEFVGERKVEQKQKEKRIEGGSGSGGKK